MAESITVSIPEILARLNRTSGESPIAQPEAVPQARVSEPEEEDTLAPIAASPMSNNESLDPDFIDNLAPPLPTPPPAPAPAPTPEPSQGLGLVPQPAVNDLIDQMPALGARLSSMADNAPQMLPQGAPIIPAAIQPQAPAIQPESPFDINRIMASNVDQLKAAQDERDALYRQALANRGIERTMEGINQLGGIEYKPDLAALNEQVRLAQMPVTKVKEQQDSKSDVLKLQSTANKLKEELQDAEAMNNPNSIISQVYRNVAEKSGVMDKVPPDATAKSLDKVLGLSKTMMGNALQWAKFYQHGEEFDKKQAAQAVRTKLLQDKFKWAQNEKNELGDKYVKEVSEIDNNIKNLGSIEKASAQFNTGPVAGRLQNLKQKFGVDFDKTPEYAAFKANTVALLASYIFQVSGKAVTDAERKILEQVIPNITMGDKTFASVLDSFKQRLATQRDTVLDAFSKTKNVGSFKDADLNQDVYSVLGPYSKYSTFEMQPVEEAPAPKKGKEGAKVPPSGIKHVKLKSSGENYDVPMDKWNSLSKEQKALYEEQ